MRAWIKKALFEHSMIPASNLPKYEKKKKILKILLKSPDDIFSFLSTWMYVYHGMRSLKFGTLNLFFRVCNFLFNCTLREEYVYVFSRSCSIPWGNRLSLFFSPSSVLSPFMYIKNRKNPRGRLEEARSVFFPLYWQSNLQKRGGGGDKKLRCIARQYAYRKIPGADTIGGVVDEEGFAGKW